MVCRDLGLNANLDKCVVKKISQKAVDMEKICFMFMLIKLRGCH